MSARDEYPHGVPCWVDTLQPDPHGARAFYGAVFGWEFDGPGPGGYHVARVRGDDVAGVGTLPEGSSASSAWNTYVSVDDLDTAVERAVAAGGTLVDGPIDASPAGRLAIVGDPVGATLGLWHAEDREGAQRINDFSAWAMSELLTPQPEKAAEFYAAVFGWTLEEFAPGAWIFRLPGYVGGVPEQPVSRETVAVLVKTDGPDSTWHAGFWVDEADAAVERAQAGGGSVVSPAADSPVGREAIVADPTGAAFTVTRVNKPV